MMIPWGEITSWSCLACGNCCREGFTVYLSPYEYARILRFAPYALEAGSSKPYLKKTGARCIFLNEYGLCQLQFLDLKPLACKIWPFIVLQKPKSFHSKKARFYYNNEEYYVYINPHARSICSGIGRGKPEELPLVINEVIEIYKGRIREQNYSTAYLKTLTLNLYSLVSSSSQASGIKPAFTQHSLRKSELSQPRSIAICGR